MAEKAQSNIEEQLAEIMQRRAEFYRIAREFAAIASERRGARSRRAIAGATMSSPRAVVAHRGSRRSWRRRCRRADGGVQHHPAA